MAGKVALIYRNGKYMTTIATKEIGLEVNADKTKWHDYVSRSERRTKLHMKIYNNTIERVEEFKYLGKS